MFFGCVDRNLEALIRVEEAALKRLNELLTHPDALTGQKDAPTSSPNAELFVELNQEKRLTLELQQHAASLDRRLAQSTAVVTKLEEELGNLRENLQDRDQEVRRLNDAVQKLRQDRSQSPSLFAAPAETRADPVIAILRNRIKFLEEENSKLRDSNNS